MNDGFTPAKPSSAAAIFEAALGLSAEERARYLDDACAGDTKLRQRVEALLRANDASSRFLPESPAAPSFDALPGDRVIGDYELLEEIARGGMGVVYRARQRSLDRIVAVKMIVAGQFASHEQALRFQAEAEAAARLQHPNIVRVHETGQHEGRPFFSMDYVEGTNLSALVHEKPLAARRAALYVKIIAEAIHYAHEQGVLHRDLKPSNILIDRSDQPRITDFGLAKRVTKESFLTITGEMMGSPSFMPPEQAGARGVKAGGYSDVYSLGGILFYLVTGRPPFVAENVAEMLHHVLHTEPISPRLLNPSVPQDMATICLKCLEKEPVKRFQTARQLAEELGRFLNDEPIHARPVSPPEKLWRWSRRRPVVAGLAAALLVALFLGFAGILWQWRRAERHLEAAAKATIRAEQNAAAQASERERAEESMRRLEIQRAREMLEQDNTGPALAYLARELRQHPTNHVLASLVMSVLSLRDFPQPFHAPLAHRASVRQTQFSPDGRLLLTAADDGARLWDVATGKAVGEVMRHGDGSWRSSMHAIFNRTGDRVATVSYDGLARIWAVPTMTPVTPLLEHGAPVRYAEFSPDGARLATAAGNRTNNDAAAYVWDARTGAKLTPPLQHGGAVRMARFSPDGHRIATASHDWTVRFWRALDGQPLFRPIRFKEAPMFIEFSPDGSRLAIASYDRAVHVVDAHTGEPLLDPLSHDDPVISVHFSRDGRRLVSVAGQAVHIWHAITGQALTKPIRHNAAVLSAQFSPDGMRLVTTCWNGTARVWNSITGEPMGEPMRHEASVVVADFSPNGELVATGSDDSTTQLWNVRPRSMQALPMRHEAALADLDFSPDGRRLVTLGQDGSSRLWDAVTAEALSAMTNYITAGATVQFSPDGKRIVVTYNGWTAILADGTTGMAVQTLKHRERLLFAKFSPDGRLVATGGHDDTARVWDAKTGEPITEPLVHSNAVLSAQFSPDSSRLATGDQRGQLRFWDARSGMLLAAPPSKHGWGIKTLQFSADGSQLATGSFDRTARIWDGHTGGPRSPPLVHNFVVTVVQFSPDGRYLFTFTEQGAMRAWEVRNAQPLAELIPPNENILDARFSPDVSKVATVQADHGVRVFDVASGLPLTETFRHTQRPVGIKFSPDSRVLALASDGAARAWSLPVVEGFVPLWLPELVEAVGGWQISSNDILKSVPTRYVRRCRDRINGLTNRDPVTAWGQWYFGDRFSRSMDPGSPTWDQYFRRLETPLHPEDWRRLWAQRPSRIRHMTGFIRTCMAQALKRGALLMTEADYLSSGALALMPDDPDILDARVEVNDRLGYEHRFLTQPDAIVKAMAEFGNPRYWLASAEREAAFEHWSNALARCTLAISNSNRASPHLFAPGAEPEGSAQPTPQAQRPMEDQVRHAILFLRAQVLWRLDRSAEAIDAHQASRFIATRGPQATAQQLDLTPFYNARLDDNWHTRGHSVQGQGLDLLPAGLQIFDGVMFDVRGLIQLDGSELRTYGRRYPARVSAIPVGQTCRRVHFLHATVWSGKPGEHIGDYLFRFADGKTVTLPILYGETLADWWDGPSKIPDTGSAYRVAWKGANALARERNVVQRLYHTVWENPRPDAPLASLDLTSKGLLCGPFVVAISIE